MIVVGRPAVKAKITLTAPYRPTQERIHPVDQGQVIDQASYNLIRSGISARLKNKALSFAVAG